MVKVSSLIRQIKITTEFIFPLGAIWDPAVLLCYVLSHGNCQWCGKLCWAVACHCTVSYDSLLPGNSFHWGWAIRGVPQIRRLLFWMCQEPMPFTRQELIIFKKQRQDCQDSVSPYMLWFVFPTAWNNLYNMFDVLHQKKKSLRAGISSCYYWHLLHDDWWIAATTVRD